MKGSLSAQPIPLERITIERLAGILNSARYEGECLILYRLLHHTGYGYVSIDGQKYAAHRIIKSVSMGRNYLGLVTDHLCKNKACIRVSHLEVVTQGVNISRGTAAQRGAESKRKTTTCRRGHEYDHSYTYKNGYVLRVCNACNRLRRKMKRIDPEKHKELSRRGGNATKRAREQAAQEDSTQA